MSDAVREIEAAEEGSGGTKINIDLLESRDDFNYVMREMGYRNISEFCRRLFPRLAQELRKARADYDGLICEADIRLVVGAGE